LFKYCYKGHDCAIIEFSTNNNTRTELTDKSEANTDVLDYDEIKHYEDTRYLSAQEAMYRLNEYEMNELSHTIYRLAVHNENEQYVYFNEGSENQVLNKNNETTLTAWFKLNQEDNDANQYLYTEIPKHYVFNKKEKKWNIRKKLRKPILVRMYLVNIQQRERFFIRLLLLTVRGAKSFQDLRTYQNVTYLTFFEAAKARNLISTDEEWDKCLKESSTYMFPKAMCELFAYICVFHNPINAYELYEKYKQHFYYPNMNEVEGEKYCLSIINQIVILHGYSLSNFNLPDVDDEDYTLAECEMNNDQNINVVDDLEEKINSLTDAQRIIFNTVINALNGKNKIKCIFIDGPGGSGKSYLLNLLISYCNKHKKNVLADAWTGIAANLLKEGKTVHTTFKLPLNVNETSSCNIKPNSPYSRKIKDVQLLIWDEISMAKKHAFEAIEKCLVDLSDSNEVFGGKVVVVSGDFRQTLPIARFGNRVLIIENCVKSSKLWQNFECMSLKQNKRISENDNEFKSWLLNVGNGNFLTKYERDNEIIKIPKTFISNGNIIDEIFGNLIDPQDQSFYDSVILAPRNVDVIEINNEILNRIPGPHTEYLSIDTAENDNNENLANIIPIEFLNSLTPNGLPQHKLKFKKGSIIMLLRNLNLNNGLCNGTRLIIEQLQEYTILAKIITGNESGSHVIIPRINLSPSPEEIPFRMTRRQFPIRLAHAMTINKSQGQSFKKVGVYLTTPVFSHGQLYVALSRVMSKNNLKICIPVKTVKNIKKTDEGIDIYTKNIVYTEIL
jgi:hypothetical protein